MKNKVIFVLFMVLSIFVLAFLTGCEKEENITETESKKSDSKDLIGNYQLIELTSNGFLISEEDIKNNNIITTLDVKEDNTAILHEATGDTECGYDETEFTYIVSGVVVHAKWVYNGEKLWLIIDSDNELVFRKIK